MDINIPPSFVELGCVNDSWKLCMEEEEEEEEWEIAQARGRWVGHRREEEEEWGCDGAGY